MAQSKRKSKTSQGINGGGGKVRTLTDVQKVLMGKGMYRTTKVLTGGEK